MPFSSITDPSDLSVVNAAFASAWEQVRDHIDADQEREARQRLAYIVMGLRSTVPNSELAARAAEQFLSTVMLS